MQVIISKAAYLEFQAMFSPYLQLDLQQAASNQELAFAVFIWDMLKHYMREECSSAVVDASHVLSNREFMNKIGSALCLAQLCYAVSNTDFQTDQVH